MSTFNLNLQCTILTIESSSDDENDDNEDDDDDNDDDDESRRGRDKGRRKDRDKGKGKSKEKSSKGRDTFMLVCAATLVPTVIAVVSVLDKVRYELEQNVGLGMGWQEGRMERRNEGRKE